MKKIYKILIWLVVIILLAVALFFVFSQNFSSKENSGAVKISKIKNQYSTTEDIVLSGTSKSNCEIILSLNGEAGIVKSDENGKWIANLGKLPEGKYAFEALADDSPTSQSVATAQLLVSSSVNNTAFLNNISGIMTAALSGQPKNPDKLVMIPETIPQVFQENWKLVK